MAIGIAIESIIEYDPNRFGDLVEVLDLLPEVYVRPLLSGLELMIAIEITKATKKNQLEERKKKNRSLGTYE